MRRFCARILNASLFCVIVANLLCFAQDYGKVTSAKVADGVYLFTTTPYADVGLSGNSVAIVSDEGVLVFDSNGTPETATTVLEAIKKLTDKPVRYLVNSHWHWDHWGGNQVYLAAFPGLKIITHEKTRELMLNVEPRWNEKGLKEELPQFLEGFEKQIAEAKASKKLPEERIKAAEKRLAVDRNFLVQKQSLRKTYPDVTFSDSMTLYMGGREVRILHARAITTGDTYVYLPKEKVLVTGDILLSPYPFAIGGTYPADWLKTLESFAALGPAVVLPGHGDAENSAEFLQKNVELFREVIRQVKDAKAKGMTLEQMSDALGKQNNALAAMLGIQDANTARDFKAYFLDVFIKRAYRELEQPLGDLPDGMK